MGASAHQHQHRLGGQSVSDETAGLELRDYIRILRKNWLLILLAAVLGTAGAGAFSLLSTPLYQASTTLYVSVRSASESGVSELTQGGSYARSQVLSYADVIGSAVVLERVVEDLKLDMTVAELAEMVSASSPADTVLLEIDVTGPDAGQAAAIADSVGANFSEVVSKVLEPAEAGGTSPVQVSTIEPATAPLEPVSPNTTRNLALGLLLGLMAGVGLAVLRFALDTHIRSPQDVERLTDAPVLAGIVDDPKAERHRLIVHESPRSVRAESFRSLRTNLQFLNVGDVPRSFVITSAAPAEGKSTVATNLALSLAQTGASVVVVDADMRKPSVGKYMGVDDSVGLSNLLVGMVALEEVLHPWGPDQLFVLPAGRIPPNPSELLGSQAMKTLLERLTEQFDYVIIDSPPVLAVTDAAIMSRFAGGTIVVAAVGVARRQDVVAALGALEGIANRIVGVVVTRVPSKGPDAYYHYGRYEYARDVQEATPERPIEPVSPSPLAWLDEVEAELLPRRHTR